MTKSLMKLNPQMKYQDYQERFHLDNSGRHLNTVADLGGGMGGCIPPTSLKVTILAEKSALI